MLADPTSFMWLIPALPLAGSVIIMLFGKSTLRELSHWPCILGAVGACVLSVIALLAVANGFDDHKTYYTWFQAGSVDVGFSLRLDGLTAIMLVMVTFIGSLIAIYSVGYMHGDPGYPRFFAEVSGFLFFMTGLVLADNLILLYACWEGVGLCSYLLIGFWFAKPSAAAAARKAFLVTRLGDIGLFLGILVLWLNSGSLDYDQVFAWAGRDGTSQTTLVVACLLVFMGAAGKSAQFPLHVWLPDAMEGPSPVSALIHAATMVTAGVYLVARCMPLFQLAPDAQLVVACIGAFTALLAALIALTQTDLKRVLAYSTISQLGYMFLALGSGLRAEHLAGLAAMAAIFHLFTHAFFKALLFLASGSVMHAMGNVIDMRRFGGLRRVLPTTHWTFLCGAAALAGVPLLSGFWSKDDILAVSMEAGHANVIYTLLFISALATAGLTAFYTFRAYFMTFWGEERIPHEAGHHAHESPPVMTWPLMILAVGAVGVGLVVGPTALFAHFLEDHWMRRGFAGAIEHHFNLLLMVASSAVALGGIGIAYLMYVKQPETASNIARAIPHAFEWSRNKFYLDEIFAALVVKPVQALAYISRVIDQYFIDGLVDLIGQLPAFVGYLFRPVQNGLVQFYALLMALGLAGFLLSVLLR
jgi:NADH-quinone oxidoreductase subunit L